MSEAPEASFEAALAAFHSGAIDQAQTIAEDAVARQPAPRWHHLLGLIRCRLGDFDGGSNSRCWRLPESRTTSAFR